MIAPVRHEVRLACTPDHAFTTFVARIDRWWPRSHRRFPDGVLTLEPVVGGRIREVSPEGVAAEIGRVEAVERPHLLTYGWQPGAPVGALTRVRVRFEPDGDHTWVRVTHEPGDSGLGEQWPERAVRFARAWSEVLPALAHHIHTPPEERPHDL